MEWAHAQAKDDQQGLLDGGRFMYIYGNDHD